MPRLRNLLAALSVAAEVPVEVREADAVEWTSEQLREGQRGIATVLYHSIVLQYLEERARARLLEVLEDAGRRASSRTPVAWLRTEPAGELAGVWLKQWPGGTEG